MIRLVVPITAALAFGCGGGTPDTDVQADSAGVRILILQHAPENIPTLTLGEPRLSLGVEVGDTNLEWRSITAAAGTEDRLVVVDGGAKVIRVFGADGEFLHAMGAFGGGPAEFRNVSTLSVTDAGEIRVYDHEKRALTHWDDAGHFVASEPIPNLPSGPLHVVQPLEEGFLGIRFETSIVENQPTVNGLKREDATIVTLRNGSVDTIVAFPGYEYFYYPHSGDGRARFTMPLLAQRPVWAIVGDCIHALTAATVEIRKFCSGRGLVQIVRWPDAPLALDVAAFETEAKQTIARRVGSEIRVENFLRDYPFPIPEKRPPGGALLVDSFDNIWLAPYTELDADPDHWMVIGARGEMTRVEIPPETRLLEVGKRNILARQRDDLGVERLVVWLFPPQLQSPAGAGDRQ